MRWRRGHQAYPQCPNGADALIINHNTMNALAYAGKAFRTPPTRQPKETREAGRQGRRRMAGGVGAFSTEASRSVSAPSRPIPAADGTGSLYSIINIAG